MHLALHEPKIKMQAPSIIYIYNEWLIVCSSEETAQKLRLAAAQRFEKTQYAMQTMRLAMYRQ